MTGPDSQSVGAALETAGAAFSAAGRAASRQLAGLEPSRHRQVVLVGDARARSACEGAFAVLAASAPVPVQLLDAGRLPAFVGEGCLVVACGVGPPEERSLEGLAQEALARGGEVLLVGPGPSVEAAGTRTRSSAPAEGGAAAPLQPAVTAGLTQLLPALMAIGGWAGLSDRVAADMDEAARVLVEAGAGLMASGGAGGSPAEQLARRIGRTIPLFVGARGIGAAAARSWKRSWNLLAKAPAIATAQPGAGLEEVSGFGQHGDVTRQLLTLVVLRTGADLAEDAARSRLLAEATGEALAGVVELDSAGDADLAQLAHLEWLGLATAWSLAGREGVDPGPLAVADELARRLAAAHPAEGHGPAGGQSGTGPGASA